MKSAILTNTLNKLELEPGEAGDQKRKTAIHDIINVLQKGYREYHSIDDIERKNQIAELIQEQKKQIKEKLEGIIQNKGVYGQSSLITRLLADFEQANIELGKEISTQSCEVEKRAKENVKFDFEEIITFMKKQMNIEEEKGKTTLAQLPVPAKKENILQALWNKIRGKIYGQVKQDSQISKEKKARKQIREYNFKEEVANANKQEEKKTKEEMFKQQLQLSQEVDKQEVHGQWPLTLSKPIEQTGGIRRPVEAPGYTVQQPLGTKKTENTYSAVRPETYEEYLEYFAPMIPKGAYDNYKAKNGEGGFIKSFEEIGVNPDEVQDGKIIKKEGKKYKRVQNGLVEIIDSSNQEREE